MCETQQMGHFFGSINWRIWRRQEKWRKEIRFFSDTLKKAILQWFGFWVLGLGGSRFGTGPCQTNILIRQTFFFWGEASKFWILGVQGFEIWMHISIGGSGFWVLGCGFWVTFGSGLRKEMGFSNWPVLNDEKTIWRSSQEGPPTKYRIRQSLY